MIEKKKKWKPTPKQQTQYNANRRIKRYMEKHLREVTFRKYPRMKVLNDRIIMPKKFTGSNQWCEN